MVLRCRKTRVNDDNEKVFAVKNHTVDHKKNKQQENNATIWLAVLDAWGKTALLKLVTHIQTGWPRKKVDAVAVLSAYKIFKKKLKHIHSGGLLQK